MERIGRSLAPDRQRDTLTERFRRSYRASFTGARVGERLRSHIGHDGTILHPPEIVDVGNAAGDRMLRTAQVSLLT
jgi:hypothetical protein